MRAPIGSLLLLLCLLAMFAVELARAAPGNDAALLVLGALPDQGGLQGEWWRLLSFAFLHWNWTHLLANSALLAWLAPLLERRIGAARLWALFLLAAIASGAAIACKHYWWPAPGVSVGASGGAFAILGAAAWLLARDPGAPRRARIATSVVVLLGLAVSLWPGISLVGHLAGLALGVALAGWWSRRARVQSPMTISPVSTLRR